MNLRPLLCAVAALSFVVPVAYADICVVPGDVVLTDPVGDVVGEPVPPDPVSGAFDLQSLSIATPAAASIDEQKVVFTIQTGGEPVLFTPGSGVFISFEDPRRLVRGVRAEGDMAGGISFFSYVVSADNDGEFGGQFIEDGSQKPAEGSYAGGVLTITVAAKDIKVTGAGDTLTGFNGGGILLVGTPDTASFSLNLDSMPDDQGRGTATPVVFAPCKKSAADKAAGVAAVSDKSGTNFGGAFGLLNLLLMLPLAAIRRRFAVAALVLAAPMAQADVCVAPGDIVLEDATGDAGFQGVIPVPAPVGDFYDLAALSIAASPTVKDEGRKLTFTIDLAAQQPTPVMLPGTAIYASFLDTRKVVRGVRVQSDNMGGMTFFSYVAGSSDGTAGTPITDGRFVEAGSEVPAQPESSYAGGVATIVVKFKDIKLDEDGGVLAGFNAATTQAVSVPGAGGVAGTMDTVPDDLVHANPLEIPKCSGKSVEARALSEVADKSGTNFGGAFAPWSLLMLGLLGLRRRRV